MTCSTQRKTRPFLRHLALSCAWLAAISTVAAAGSIRVPRDYATIQGAIDAAGDGDSILVSEGTYRERITLKANLMLRSIGDDSKGTTGLLRAERTIIDGGGQRAGAGDVPGVAMAQGATIDGFTVTNVGVYDDALWKRHWEERGENQDHSAIGRDGSAGIAAGTGIAFCRIQNCIVHHNGHTGIVLRGTAAEPSRPVVTGNACFRNMGGGIGILEHVGGIVHGNRCHENFLAGIGHSGSSAPMVTANICYDNVRAGIGVSEGACPVVRGNECHGNRRAGIGIRSGADTRPVIEDNHCHHNGMAGIGIDEAAEPFVRGNRCENNAMAGIGAQGGAQPILVGNQCRGNAAAGIGLRAGSAGILRNNLCEDNSLVAIGLLDGTRAIISGNTLSRAGGMPPLVAIRGGSEAVMIGNTLRGGGVAGVLLEGRAILSDNVIAGSDPGRGNGIWLWNGSAALASGNVISGFKTEVQQAEDARWQKLEP